MASSKLGLVINRPEIVIPAKAGIQFKHGLPLSRE